MKEVTDLNSLGAQKVPPEDDFDRRSKQNQPLIYAFTRAWHEWADGTTCHGIKFVFDGGSPIIRRIFWFVLFGGLVYYLVSMCVIQTQRFIAYKTATKTTLTLEKNLSFPAVTICNFNLIKNDSVSDPDTRTLLKELYMKIPNITTLKELGDEFLNNVSLKELFQNGTPSIEETFLFCQILIDIVNCRKLLQPKITELAHCYTFNSKENNETYTVQNSGYQDAVSFTAWLNQDNYFIGDHSSAGIKVIIHDPSEEPDYRLGLSFSPGYSYFVSLRKKTHTFLPYPVKAFGSRECVDTKSIDFKNPLKYADDYSPYACMTECSTKYVRDKCGCATVFDIGTLKECTPMQHIECTYFATRNFTSLYDTESCGCPLPCTTTTYETTVSSAYFPNSNFLKILIGNASLHSHYRDNMVQVRVYYETMITTHEEQILEFTKEDLIASFGGFLGLAIGASMITILEFFEMFVVCMYRCLKK